MDRVQPAAPDTEIVIVGTGFSGLCMAIRLLKAGRTSFIMLERADEVGGTWRENTYPGCACDIPSRLYSLSFEPRWDWSRDYPGQSEILAYLRDLADKYGLRQRIRFGSELVEAAFDEARDLWRLTMRDGRMLTCRVLVSAMGPLTRPAYPALPGVERFAGESFHSATWNHDFDLAGKRVAVIGTGASAIQFVPQIAPQVAALHLFQRTPPWVLPKADRPVPDRRRRLLEMVPGYGWLLRQKSYWEHELAGIGFAVDPDLMKRVETQARRYLQRKVRDPALHGRLTPDYRLGCKRVLFSNDYYPTLNRANVELVTDPIAELRPHSVVTRDGSERAVDAIIYATGFKATEFLASVRIVGRGGQVLAQAWRDGAEAYLGTSVAGFPNLFLLVGPNTGLGHNSLVFMIEAQVRYVMGCLKQMKRRRATALELRSEAHRDFNTALQSRMRRTVWKTGCRSWYLDANGRNTTLWPGLSVEYWLRTLRPRTADYRFTADGEKAGTEALSGAGNMDMSPTI